MTTSSRKPFVLQDMIDARASKVSSYMDELKSSNSELPMHAQYLEVCDAVLNHVVLDNHADFLVHEQKEGDKYTNLYHRNWTFPSKENRKKAMYLNVYAYVTDVPYDEQFDLPLEEAIYLILTHVEANIDAQFTIIDGTEELDLAKGPWSAIRAYLQFSPSRAIAIASFLKDPNVPSIKRKDKNGNPRPKRTHESLWKDFKDSLYIEPEVESDSDEEQEQEKQ